MRKLSARHKKRLVYRCLVEQMRLCRRPAKIVSKRRQIARDNFLSMRANLPEAALDFSVRPGYCTIVPPARFCLDNNFDATMAFIMDMRSLFAVQPLKSPDGKHNLRVFSDFAAIKEITPSAGLVLAAEVDRWRIASGKQPRSFDGDWHPAVQMFFLQAGLFELLGIKPDCEAAPATDSSIETLQFVRGFSVTGKDGSKLRDRLEALCGKSIGPRTKVYEAIAEAIANTRHAYPSGVSIWPSKLSGRWWASGAWNRLTNVVSIHLYDQGVGIPGTLPRSEHWSDVLNFLGLSKVLNPEARDDKLLEAALEVGRTSTKVHGRGNGLAEMAGWIDHRDSGFLRITSGRGTIMYRSGGVVEGSSRRAAFPGTLVEWEIALDE